MPTDWIVWPIFLAQLFIIVLVFLPKNIHFLGLKLHTIIIILLFAVCYVILLSLFHDSTDALHVYF